MEWRIYMIVERLFFLWVLGLVEGEVGERGRGRRWLSWRRLFALIMVVVVLAAVLMWVVVPYVQEQFKREGLKLYSCWWTRNSEGNITQATLRLYNNGTKRLTISKVFVNQTEIDTTDWGCQYGLVYDPRSAAWMYVAPQSMAFQEGTAYNLTVGTEAGGRFSYMVEVEGEDVFQEEFSIKWVSFYDWRYWGDPLFADVCVENHHHTLYAVVTERRINGSLFGAERYWIPAGTVGGEALCIPFIFNWTRAATYTFTLRTACGNTYNYTKTAPP